MPRGGDKATKLRSLPSVDRVLGHQRIQALTDSFRRDWVVGLVRQRLEEARSAIGAGKPAPTLAELVDSVSQRARSLDQVCPSPLINATGVIIHTNLGRAPLSAEAIEAMVQAARGYSNLELELAQGKRGSRQAHVQPLLCQLTGAEAALVVNNNASAVLLGLTALAQGGDVIVSRGEAVEIGGGFRIPEVLRQSGATLVEVGTTNRTYASDYEAAITPQTATLLKVHASNFRVSGFTHAPTLEELVELGRQHGIPVLHDLGSGCLLDTEAFLLAHEPTPQESVAAGVGLAFFSGDKLLGGPQAGIVVGQRELVHRLERHPLARAVRLDKLGLAALVATLMHYVKDQATEKVPIWRMIALPAEELEATAHRWQEAIGPSAAVHQGLSTVGGGSLPGETLPTWVLALDSEGTPGGAEALAQRLRQARPPVMARIESDRVMLDPRTVLPEEEPALLQAIRQALEPQG
ncbi:MAG: L-seryl-tRNA(Sec) selenium transferase [Dehalococcoidia bacterium]